MCETLYKSFCSIQCTWLNPLYESKLVSVIVPTYQRAWLICKTLDSVLGQTYRPIELIVVDDGSTDNTKQTIKEWQENAVTDSDFRFKYIRQVHIGTCAARNRGAVKSRGEYLQFLDSDDLLGPQKISAQVECLSRQNYMHAVFGDFRRFAHTTWGILVYPAAKLPRYESALRDWLGGRFSASHSILWRRKDLAKIGSWNETLTANQDGDLATRFLLNNGRLTYCWGGWSYYRCYFGRHTRITKRVDRDSMKSKQMVLKQIEHILEDRGGLESYREVLANAYFELAEDSSLNNREIMEACLKKYYELKPNRDLPGSITQRTLRRVLGIRTKKWVTTALLNRLKVPPFMPITFVSDISDLYAYDSA